MMVVGLLRYVAGAAFALATLAPAVLAHSTTGVQAELEGRERYVQFVEREAPSFVLADVEGREVRLADFGGKVVMLNFIYARCREKCPLHSRLIAEVQSQLGEAGLGDRVQFLSIATDTEDPKDTADILRGYGARYGLDPANWVFLHGGTGGTDTGIEVAKRYGLE
ncbi:MAG: SCO family protein, partial [Gammaproteobacteria bacterium]|nr:SCO family protein [Gammaproteobacteria bacterium]NIR85972.1 SCO family protein [Gammaproteobacteria bacterium]NIR91963.1 SCO family protein [Gammaproteobacteria bacterium]NIU07213.1 SCO family protein [Gammaproteobacteria bacterium]NIV74214.1 redoxin domain-containing protein [Gammaproteobacteria bacterium]